MPTPARTRRPVLVGARGTTIAHMAAGATQHMQSENSRTASPDRTRDLRRGAANQKRAFLIYTDL